MTVFRIQNLANHQRAGETLQQNVDWLWPMPSVCIILGLQHRRSHPGTLCLRSRCPRWFETRRSRHYHGLPELLTSPPFFSDKGFPEDAEYDDATLEGMLREGHRVHSHHSQREDFSVGLSSSSVSERTGRLVGEESETTC